MSEKTPERGERIAPKSSEPTAPKSGERIAKVLARAGVASRRGAEAMIAAGRVAVNGRSIDSPALNVDPGDRITVDGAPLAQAEPPRLWLYHKPRGLVTTERDEKGRPTVFAALPEEMPRVMSVGRLDLNSEGLLLLTNDGGIKRRLELPATGWLRRYRVRVKGVPTEADLDPLRAGVTVENERFQPMQVTLDRQQGANAWITVALREGRNREVRRAMEAVGFAVNRLIRVSYGPFQLGGLAAGAVEEVRAKVLRDQLGLDKPEPTGAGGARGRPGDKRGRGSGAKSGGKPGADPRSGPKSDPRSDSKSVSKSGPDKKTGAKSGARTGPRTGIGTGTGPDAEAGTARRRRPPAKRSKPQG